MNTRKNCIRIDSVSSRQRVSGVDAAHYRKETLEAVEIVRTLLGEVRNFILACADCQGLDWKRLDKIANKKIGVEQRVGFANAVVDAGNVGNQRIGQLR